MDILSRISILLSERHLKQRDLTDHLKLNHNAYTDWKKGRSQSYMKMLPKIADFLGVSVSDLIGETASQKDAEETEQLMSQFSVRDAQLVKAYHELDARGREIVNAVLSFARESLQIERSRPVVQYLIGLPKSMQAVSAGTGVILEPEMMERTFVKDTPAARKASFLVPVNGDSMEPVYHDGDVLFVESAAQVERGEIGIFMLDGQGFVKRLGDGVLEPLNDKYPIIPNEPNTRCFGRVIGILEGEEERD